jgi:alpha-glucosidase
MKNLIITLGLLFYTLNASAEKFLTEIKPLAGEKWYGAYTAKAYCNTPLKNLTFQPYLANEKRKDLTIDNRGNQAAPFLLSNRLDVS